MSRVPRLNCGRASWKAGRLRASWRQAGSELESWASWKRTNFLQKLNLTSKLEAAIIDVEKRKEVDSMKYFMVICHRGHCRSGRSTEIKFVFEAENLVAACENARKMPSVKHSRMVLYGREISKSEYEDFRKISAYERFPQHQKRRR